MIGPMFSQIQMLHALPPRLMTNQMPFLARKYNRVDGHIARHLGVRISRVAWSGGRVRKALGGR
jgi:hypothetical protein